MGILKFPRGSNPRIEVNGRMPRLFSNYGVAALQNRARTLRSTVLDIPGPFDTARVTRQPDFGHATIREDGRLTLNLGGVDLAQTPGEIEIEIETTLGGQTSIELLGVTLDQGLQLGGWGGGTHYMLPKDANDAIQVEPGVRHRKLYCDPAGYTKAQIEAREGISNASRNWLLANPALGGNGAYYGETPELAVDEDRARQIWIGLCNDQTSSHWLLLKRGARYDTWAGGGPTGVRGESGIHPVYIGAYGTGARPVLAPGVSPSDGDFLVIQGLEFEGLVQKASSKFTMLDDIVIHDSLNAEGIAHPIQYVTFRRIRGWDIVKTGTPRTANGGTTWASHSNRHQGSYLANHEHVLIEDCFIDRCGWAAGYDIDADINNPNQPPSQYSHVIYASGFGEDLTLRRNTFCRGALTGVQGRTGVFFHDNFFVGNNLGILLGGGPDSETVPNGQDGNWSLGFDNGITWAGQKQQSTDNFKTANGFRINADSGALKNNFVIAAGPGNDGTEAWGVTTQGANAVLTGDAGTIESDDTLVYDWIDAPDAGLGGLDPATLDATTLETFARAELGDPQADRYTLMAHFRTLEAPWSFGQSMLRWFQERLERVPAPRIAPQNLRFAPRTDGTTPGHRWDCRFDWSTQDLPGRVAGDVADLDGHDVLHSFSPDHPLGGLHLGGGRLTQFGGRLDIAGPVTGPGTLHCDGAGQIWLAGGPLAGGVSIEAQAGRIANTQSLTGAFDLTLRGTAQALLGLDTSDCTIAAGHRMVLKGGRCRAGFDGAAGGLATLTLAGLLRFETGMELYFTGRDYKVATFRPGTIITGATSGFSARIVQIEDRAAQVQGILILDDISGTPLVGEDLVGEGLVGRAPVPAQVLAQVDQVPVPGLSQITPLRSGLWGTDAPNVQTGITLGGTLEIDLEGYEGTLAQDLLQADAITGAFAAVDVQNLGGRDAILTQSATALHLAVSTGGTGQVTLA